MLYFMRASQAAVAFERRANWLYSDATAHNPDSLENGASHDRALMMYGRIETDLIAPSGRANFQGAQELPEHWGRAQPRDRYIPRWLDEVQAGIKELESCSFSAARSPSMPTRSGPPLHG